MKNERTRRFARKLASLSPFAALFARSRRHLLPPVLRPAARVH